MRMPLLPVSDEPMASMSSRSGKRSRYRSLTVGEKMAAVEASTNIEDRSSGLGPPRSSRASTIGRAMASPVIDTVLTRSRSIVRHTSAASNLRQEHDAVALEGEAPEAPLGGAVHERRQVERRHPAVGLGRLLGQRPLVGHPLVRVGVDAAAEGEEHVLVAPHHALGHARGAAGVDDVVVVVGAGPEVALGAPRRPPRPRRRTLPSRASTSSVAAGSQPSSMWMRCCEQRQRRRAPPRSAGASSRSKTSAFRSALSNR